MKLILGVLLALLAYATAEAHELSPDQLRTVRFEQHIGAGLPLDLAFTDDVGRAVYLRDFFEGKPVVLTLNYLRCQNLCPLELQGLIGGLNGVPFVLGDEYTLLTISFDARETPDQAATAKFKALRGYVHPEAMNGWHVLTTQDQQTIDALTQAVGFNYVYDDQEDDYAHPLGVLILTETGAISRYVYGLDFSATDLRLALTEAAQQRLGGLTEQVLLLCYHYDALTGRYTPVVLDVLKMAGAATVLAVGGALFALWRADLRRI
ncbi:MAG TPA: SCO family protein [Chloroflexota bacterium]|jgi:protein SCO1/2